MSQTVSNGNLTVTAPDTAADGVGQNNPLPGYRIAITDPVKGETVQAVIMTNFGDLDVFGRTGSYTGELNGVTITGGRPTCITLTGSVSAVNRALATLTNDESSAVSDELWINVSDSEGDNTNSSADTLWTPLSTAAAPVLSGVASVSGPSGKLTSLPAFTVSELGASSNESFTATISDGFTELTDTVRGVTGSGSTSLTLRGSLNLIAIQLRHLHATFVDTPAGDDTMTITVTDSFGNTTGSRTVKMVATAAAGAAASVSQAAAINGVAQMASAMASMGADSGLAPTSFSAVQHLSPTFLSAPHVGNQAEFRFGKA
jgi:hypothetical protein